MFSSGDGIWKSVNAGKTWEHVGLKNSRHIPRIRIHPKNPDIVYAGVLGDLYKSSEERGVYKSVDGGKTWKKVLYSNADAGVVDLIIDPNNPRIFICYNMERKKNTLQSFQWWRWFLPCGKVQMPVKLGPTYLETKDCQKVFGESQELLFLQ